MLGTVILDGGGKITGGNLTMTVGDNGPHQDSCTAAIPAGGSYVVNNTTPGTGTMKLPVTSGVVNFALVIPSYSGKRVDVLENDDNSKNPLGVIICGEKISSLVLKGHMQLVPQDNGDHED